MAEHLFAAAVPDSIYAVDGWLLRTTLAGGVILLVGSLWMLLTRQPAQRQRLGELSLLAALLVALPAALPTWWSLPSFDQHPVTQKAIFGSGRTITPDPLPRDEKALKDIMVATDDYWDNPELTEAEVLSLLMPTEKAKPRKDESTIKEQERQGENTKGAMMLPFTSSAWFKWTLRIIGITYILLVGVLLARCTLGYYGLWRYWRNRRPAPAHVHAALAELEPNPARRPRIGVNNLVHGPVSYGLWKPTILLPTGFCNEGDPDKLRWILAHELTHLRRRDAWGCMLLALGGALYFHLPWFWWMKRHVRLAQEYLADAAAVKYTNAVEYAQYLVSLTTLASRPTLASSQAAGVFDNPSDLYRRVHMLLHQRSVLQRSTPRWWTLTAAASFLTLAACTTGFDPLHAEEPKQPEIELVVVEDDGNKAEGTISLSFDGKTVKGDGKAQVILVTDDNKRDPVTLRLAGKLAEHDGKHQVVFVTDDEKGGKVALRLSSKVTDNDGKHQVVIVTEDDGDGKGDKKHKLVQGFQLSDGNQAKVEEALRKLDAALSKLPRQIDADTRKQLEDLKKTLQSMKGQGATWKLAEGQDHVRSRLIELNKKAGEDAKKAGDDAKRTAEIRLKLAQEYAAKAKDQAQAAEKQAKAAQEKALARWKEAKDGKGKDEAIKELERAIADKEKALAELKSGEARRWLSRVENVRSYDAPSSKGRLGVVVGDIDSKLRSHLDLNDNQGLMINEVIEPSAAWNNGNGLRNSDILIELAGKKVPSNQDQFREMVGKLNEAAYNAVVIRKGKKVNINGIKLPAAEKTSKVTFVPAEGTLEKADLAFKVNLADKIKLAENVKLLDKVQLADLAKVELDLANVARVKAEDLAKHDVIVDLVKPAQLAERSKLVDKVIEGKPVVRTLPGDLTVTRSSAPLLTKVVQGGAKPRLGVTLEEVPEVVAAQVELADNRGLYVTEVLDGTPAKKAGFQKNDILIEFADKPVTRDHAAFSKSLREMKAGKYTATVIRKGKEIRIREINLAEVKSADEEKKAKAREWEVDEEKKADMKEKAKAKDMVREKKQEKDDFFPNAGRGFQRVGGNTSVTLNNGQFTAKSTNEGKTITVVGKMTAGKADPSSITIKTDDEEKKYKSLKEVPAEDKAEVERLLGSFRGGNFQFGGNAFRFNNGLFEKQFQEQMKLLEKQMEEFGGQGNLGLEQMQKQLEEMRKRLRQFERDRNGNDDDSQE